MKNPIETVNGIDIFEMDNGEYYMLKKGWATIGCYYTIEEARRIANGKSKTVVNL